MLAIAGLACSVLGAVAVGLAPRHSEWMAPILFAFLGLALSLIALRFVGRTWRRGLPIVIAGIVIGGGTSALVVAYIVLVAIAFVVSPP